MSFAYVSLWWQQTLTVSFHARAGAVLKLHHAMPTAIVFARRYFSVKAMQENDRFIVACACLFLAAKCEEELRALNDVCYQTYKARQATLARSISHECSSTDGN